MIHYILHHNLWVRTITENKCNIHSTIIWGGFIYKGASHKVMDRVYGNHKRVQKQREVTMLPFLVLREKGRWVVTGIHMDRGLYKAGS